MKALQRIHTQISVNKLLLFNHYTDCLLQYIYFVNDQKSESKNAISLKIKHFVAK